MKTHKQKTITEEIDIELPAYFLNWDTIEASGWTTWIELRLVNDYVLITDITERSDGRADIVWTIEVKHETAENCGYYFNNTSYSGSTRELFRNALRNSLMFMKLGE